MIESDRHGDEGISCHDKDRLGKVHQPSSPTFAIASNLSRLPDGIKLEDRNWPSGLDPFQVETRNNSILGESEREVRIVVERDHGG